MKVLITGSEGVLGSVLKEELRRRGHDVYGCDLSHSYDSQVMRADISDYRQIDRVFYWCKPDLVYHLAAEFGRKNGQDFYEQLWNVNCVGTRNVIEECLNNSRGLKPTLIFASSSEVYGLSEEYAPPSALLSECLVDQNVIKFYNEYSLSKWVNERQIHTAVRNHDLNAIILRFFNVYGPPERYNPYRSVVCQFAYKMLRGEPVTVNREGYRSHLWIGDWCSTVAGIPDRLDVLMNSGIWPGSAGCLHTPVFNIGGIDYESISDLYWRLRKLIPTMGGDIFIDKEVANTATKRPDNTLAQKWLDHNPKMNLDRGLELTVEFLKREYDL